MDATRIPGMSSHQYTASMCVIADLCDYRRNTPTCLFCRTRRMLPFIRSHFLYFPTTLPLSIVR